LDANDEIQKHANQGMIGEEVDKHKCFVGFVYASKTLPYDNDLRVDGFEKYIKVAWLYKCSYDKQLHALREKGRLSLDRFLHSPNIIVGCIES